MSATYEKGALWRKWDLHIHTPASIVQNYGGDKAWPEFEKRIRNLPEDVKVIGINDYYFLDGYERVIHQKLSGDYENIEKIFPILEFRIDTFASAPQNKFSKINLHILFDIDEDDISNQIEFMAHDGKLWATAQGRNLAIQGVQAWMTLIFMYSLSR